MCVVGHQNTPCFAVTLLATSVWAMLGGGCETAQPRSQLSLESPDSAVRAAAAINAGERGDHSAIPLLVDRLEDEDQAVRFYAILALERLTGTRMGYHYGALTHDRRAGVERWRRYLVETAGGGEALGTSGDE